MTTCHIHGGERHKTTVFKSKALDTGEHFSYTFIKSGKYPYFCSVHPKMVAEVVVQ